MMALVNLCTRSSSTLQHIREQDQKVCGGGLIENKKVVSTTQKKFWLLCRDGAFPFPLAYLKKWSQRVIHVERDLRRSQPNLKLRAGSALTSVPVAECSVQLRGFHSKDSDCKTPLVNLFHCLSCLIMIFFASSSWPSWQPFTGLIPVFQHLYIPDFQHLYCAVGPKTGHSITDAVRWVLSKGELSLPLICRTLKIA